MFLSTGRSAETMGIRMLARRMRITTGAAHTQYTFGNRKGARRETRHHSGARAANLLVRSLTLLSLFVFSACAANSTAPAPNYHGGSIPPRTPYSTLNVPLHWTQRLSNV